MNPSKPKELFSGLTILGYPLIYEAVLKNSTLQILNERDHYIATKKINSSKKRVGKRLFKSFFCKHVRADFFESTAEMNSKKARDLSFESISFKRKEIENVDFDSWFFITLKKFTTPSFEKVEVNTKSLRKAPQIQQIGKDLEEKRLAFSLTKNNTSGGSYAKY